MDENNRYSELIVSIVIACIVLAILAVSCGVGYSKIEECDLVHKKYDRKWSELRDSIYAMSFYLDSVPLKSVPSVKELASTNLNNKEVVSRLLTKEHADLIIHGQQALLARQDQLTDDLRQETNNIINKMNGWLGFWLSVMALIGVFVPLALQFKIYKDVKYTETDLKDSITKDADKINSEMKNEILKIEAEINRNEEESKKRIDDSIKSLDYMGLTVYTRTFHQLADCPSIDQTQCRDILIERNWVKIISKIHKIISNYCQKSDSPNRNLTLSIALVQVMDILESVKKFNKHRSRKINLIISQTAKLIEFINNPATNQQLIENQLEDYCSNLQTLSPIII